MIMYLSATSPVCSGIQSCEMRCVPDNLAFEQLQTFINRISHGYYGTQRAINMHCHEAGMCQSDVLNSRHLAYGNSQYNIPLCFGSSADDLAKGMLQAASDPA